MVLHPEEKLMSHSIEGIAEGADIINDGKDGSGLHDNGGGQDGSGPPKVISGYMFKRARSTWNVFKAWQRRYFILDAGVLEYWHNEEEAARGGHPGGRYFVSSLTMKQEADDSSPTDSDFKTVLSILFSGDNLLILAFDSKVQFNDWCQALNLHSEHAAGRKKT
jgi:hypothetical protein